MFKVSRIICELALMIYRPQINTCESIAVSSAKSRDPIGSESLVCHRLGDVLKNLRRGRETSIIQLVDVLNQSLLLDI